MKPNSLLKKYKKKASIKYIPSGYEKLNRILRKLSDSNEKISTNEILQLMSSLLLLEKKGSINGVEIKFLKNMLSITWDDKDLGSPILIEIKEEKTMVILEKNYNIIKESISVL